MAFVHPHTPTFPSGWGTGCGAAFVDVAASSPLMGRLSVTHCSALKSLPREKSTITDSDSGGASREPSEDPAAGDSLGSNGNRDDG